MFAPGINRRAARHELHPREWTEEKGPLPKEEKSNELASQLKRRQFCFELYTLIIVEEYEVVNEQLRFMYRLRLVTSEALGFQYPKEVFSHGVIIAVSTS